MRVESLQAERVTVADADDRRADLFVPVDAASVAVFRMGFGGVMVLWATVELVLNRVADHYIRPAHLFSYPGFGWLSPLPGSGMYVVFAAIAGAAAAMALGIAYRVAAVIFCVTFTYVFLLDQTVYQNHYYLVCLLGLLMCAIPADRCWSLQPSGRGDASNARCAAAPAIPAWCLWILRFQIGCVYFFGGVAKLNADWLHGSPMRDVLAASTQHPIIGAVCRETWLVQMITRGGLLFDLLIVPALVWRKSRTIAFVLAVLFHLANASLFPIGIFPWLMLFSTTLFFEPDWPRRLWMRARKSSVSPSPPADVHAHAVAPRLTLALLACYVILQLAIPLRHFACPGNVDWTEEGHAFSWHMMLRGKTSAVRFHVRDPATGRTGTFPLRGVLQSHQVARMSRDPRLIRDFAGYVNRVCRQRGAPNVEVRAFVLCSLNGRKPQLLVDPTVDLARMPAGSSVSACIVPLHEPLPARSWNEPLDRWEDLVMRDPHLRKTGVAKTVAKSR